MGKALSITRRALTRALPTGLIGCLLLTGVHFLTLTAGVAKPWLASGKGWPAAPSLPVTTGSIAVECLVAALPLIPVLALCSYAGRVIGCLAFLAIWAFGGAHLGLLFAPDYGSTWASSEALREIYFAGSFTVVALCTSLFVLWTTAPFPERNTSPPA